LIESSLTCSDVLLDLHHDDGGTIKLVEIAKLGRDGRCKDLLCVVALDETLLRLSQLLEQIVVKTKERRGFRRRNKRRRRRGRR